MENTKTEIKDFREKDFKAFDIFDKQWAVITAGGIDHFNCCTVSWGSLGNIWGYAGNSIPIVTVYIHPARYTSEFMKESDTFTVSFFPKDAQKAMAYIGSHSGRDGDKVKAAGLTPAAVGKGVMYEEASLTLVCRKLYQHQFSKEDLAPEIQDFYASRPESFPDFKGGWQPHIMFIGGIESVIDKHD